ncbi:hypothetical protein [uncultured Amphritea sp.]|uniref:hypothetical protein n=1 Tax=uncultured Amphritea sp. TaxID=981605 RepID=UPI002638E6E4|nr:hypothetical protein [uncultured Amphritea sp.]
MSEQDNLVSKLGQNVNSSTELESSAMPEHWQEFVEYITNGNLVESHPGGYEVSPDIVDQLRERLDFGLDDVLVQHQYEQFVSGFNAPVSEDGLGIEDFFPEPDDLGINDFFPESDPLGDTSGSGAGGDSAGGDSGSVAESTSSFSSLIGDIENEYSQLNDPLDEGLGNFESAPNDPMAFEVYEDPLSGSPDMNSLPQDSEFETVEPIADSEELEEEAPEEEKNETKRQDIGRKNDQENGQEDGQYQATRQLNSPGLGSSMYQMARSLFESGANITTGAAGLTAGVGTWGAERLAPLREKVRNIGRSVDKTVEKADQMTQEQGEAFRQKFRESTLGARTEAIADIINQVGAESYFLNGAASDGLDYSIKELISECRAAEAADPENKDDNKLAKLARHALKEYVSDFTVDSLIDRVKNIEYGNKLVQTYVDHSLPLMEKLGLDGQEIKASIEGPLTDFIEDMNGVSKDLEFLLDVANNAGIMTAEEQVRSDQTLDGLKETVAGMMDKVRNLMAKFGGAQAMPQPGM